MSLERRIGAMGGQTFFHPRDGVLCLSYVIILAISSGKSMNVSTPTYHVNPARDEEAHYGQHGDAVSW